jgi:hypothetical protein
MSWRRQSFRYGLLAVLLVSVTALALYVVMVLGAPTTGPAPTPGVKASSPAPAPPATPAKAPPFSAYDVVVKRDLFRTGPPPQTRAPLPPVPTFSLPPAEVPEEEPSPVADWSYVGYAVVDGRMTAILENSTKASEFVRAGDTFVGLQMSAVTPDTVTLTGPSGDYTLPISTAFNTTPLNITPGPGQPPMLGTAGNARQGRGLTPQGRTPTPGTPGAPAPTPTVTGIFNSPPSVVTMPNPNSADAEMLRRWQQIRDRMQQGRRSFRQGNGQGTTQPQPSTGPSGQQ